MQQAGDPAREPSTTLGGLGLDSRTKQAFDTQDQMLAALMSSLGGVVVSAARGHENLRAAIASRQVIGEAIGILRSQSTSGARRRSRCWPAHRTGPPDPTA